MLLSGMLSRSNTPVLSPATWQAWAPLGLDAESQPASEKEGAPKSADLTAPHGAASTRDVILDAAEKCFAERGYACVAMREITAEAGLKNPGSLYHYFRGKRALYEAVLARGLDPIVALVAASGQAISEAGGVPALRRGAIDTVLDRLLDYLAEHPHLPRLIERAGLDESRDVHGALSELLNPLYAKGLRVLASLAGGWNEADVPHLATGIYHLIFGYFADAGLLEGLLQREPFSPAAMAHQRRFIKAAVARLLGIAAPDSGAGGDT